MVIFHSYVSLPEGNYMNESMKNENRDYNGMVTILLYFTGGFRFATFSRGKKMISSFLILLQGISQRFSRNKARIFCSQISLAIRGISQRIAQVLCQRKPTWPWLLLRLRLGRVEVHDSACPSRDRYDGYVKTRHSTSEKSWAYRWFLSAILGVWKIGIPYFSEKSSWRCLKTWWQMAIINGKESLRIPSRFAQQRAFFFL